jgi:hypothetical protein
LRKETFKKLEVWAKASLVVRDGMVLPLASRGAVLGE